MKDRETLFQEFKSALSWVVRLASYETQIHIERMKKIDRNIIVLAPSQDDECRERVTKSNLESAKKEVTDLFQEALYGGFGNGKNLEEMLSLPDEVTLYMAIKHYGASAQIDKAIEEMGELTQALLKERHTADTSPERMCVTDSVNEEMADAIIMMRQLLMIFGNAKEVEEVAMRKIVRLKSRIGEGTVTCRSCIHHDACNHFSKGEIAEEKPAEYCHNYNRIPNT